MISDRDLDKIENDKHMTTPTIKKNLNEVFTTISHDSFLSLASAHSIIIAFGTPAVHNKKKKE